MRGFGCERWNKGADLRPLQSDSLAACMLVSLRLSERQNKESKTGMCGSPLKSELPPDSDSNQTLTASCRADVWAAATFTNQKIREQTRDRWRENNSKKQLDTWERT